MFCKKMFVYVLIVMLTLTAGTVVSAQSGSLSYWKSYDLDGLIYLKMLAGSLDGAGQHKTLIDGQGSLNRIDRILMSGSNLSVYNDSNWVADPHSPRGLTVASTFQLPEDETLDAEAHQVFAVSVKADRGESGSLTQEIGFEADPDAWESTASFAISQYAMTSGGTLKRYIDIVDPQTGQYIFEDGQIRGYARIWDELRSTAEELPFNAAFYTFESAALEGEDQPLIVDGGELFEQQVPLGTGLEELNFITELDLETDYFIIENVIIEWNYESQPPYDPLQEGVYIFSGELIFPDNIFPDQPVFILFTVTVVDEAGESVLESGDDMQE